MDLSSLTSSNRLLYVLIAAIALLVFLTVILILRNIGGQTQESVTLEFWGVFDEQQAYDAIMRDFQRQHPNVRITYSRLPYESYEQDVVNALAAGSGPDIWMIHNTWLPKHGAKLQPLPENIPGQDQPLMSIKRFREDFVDVAYQDLVRDGEIFALPLYVDTLALYYNRDLFNSAGISQSPKSWDDFNNDVELLTKLDQIGNVTQSGAAIGSARNINRSTDILMALMIQSGVQMTDPDDTSATFAHSVDNQQVGEIALRYYTDFTNPAKETYTWNDNQHYSVDAFSEGATAMMFNYSHQIDIVRGKAPRLSFTVAPMPQLSSSDSRTFANYWAPAVTTNSAHPAEAWEFIEYLASKENAQRYLVETKRPAARRDLIETQRSDPDLGVFAVQALTAQSWYQIDNTAIETIFANMIDDVNFGRATPKEALQNAESSVDVLMRRR